MREKIYTILFVVVLVFISVFCWQIFYKLFITISVDFSNTAIAAFFGAFLAFLFMRLSDFFKSCSDRISKGHNSLVKIEHLLNALLGTLDENIYVIETFEELYEKNVKNQTQSHVFVWANRLNPLKLFDELLPDLLNIDLVNELFTLNIHLRKLNEDIETTNAAYKESKDALISKAIPPDNYLDNITIIKTKLVVIKDFFGNSIYEVTRALSAVQVLVENRPLMGYLLKRLPSYNYGRKFEEKRMSQLNKIRHEIDEGKKSDKTRIDQILKHGEK